MIIKFEYELNRSWVYDEDGNIVGETNFVVPAKWLIGIFNELNGVNKFVCKYKNFENFLDWYEPETDGELIYQCAIKSGVIKEPQCEVSE